MKNIYVSRTLLPKMDDYVDKLKKVWETNWLTNDGELVQELEKKLQDYWNIKHVVCVCNGTAAIQTAIRALGIKDKIYMSPFNFIATAQAPMWIGVKPEFVDLNEKYKGPALVTHNYGAPEITNARPVIYDASHAFAVNYKGKSIMHQGDVSIISFHAVKIFQTVEGGAVVTNNDEIAEKARWIRNYGYNTRYTFHGVATNFKMSEFHAAMGLCVLPQVKKVVKRYSQIIKKYNKALGYKHKDLTYYPVLCRTEKDLLKAVEMFEKNNIFVRRYFYPPLNKVFGGRACPEAEEISSCILALPLYHELTDKDVDRIIDVAIKTL